MIKNEWQALFKNKFLIVVLLALMLIPALYNVIFLSSMWDPYGAVKDLPVAVVNDDRAATLDGQQLALGKNLSADMKASGTMDYQYVSASAAADGLKSGKYYMVVSFPENLSKNAASLVTADPQKVKINYQTSQGHNFIASKMSESAMQQLQLKVSQEITQKYTETLFSNLSQLKSGLTEAAAGSGKIESGSVAAAAGSAKISDNLQTLAASSLTFSDGSSQLTEGLQQYMGNLSVLTKGAGQLNAATAAFTDGTQKLSAGIAQLTAQSGLSATEQSQLTDLQSGLTQLNAAIQSGGNAQELTATLTTLAAAAQSLAQAGSTQAAAVEATSAYQALDASQQAEILSALQNSAPTAAIQQIAQAAQELQAQLTASNAAQQQLQATSAQLLPAANQSISQLTGGLAATQTALNSQLLPAAQLLVQNSVSLQQGAEKLSTGAAQLQSFGPQLTNASSQLTEGAAQIHSGSGQLSSGSNQLTGSLSQLTAANHQLTNSLTGAGNQLSSVKTTKQNATSLAAPLTTVHRDSDNVPENGIGMAPYMISVALFVGALAANLMLGRSVSGKKALSGRDFLLGKLATNGLVAVGQGILVSLAVFAIGLHPNNVSGFILGNVLIALAFMMMVTFLNLWLGKVGAFVSLIFLLLQLATSAGTYPIQLEFPIFQAINPWLPMTYSVLYLRQVISLTSNVGLYALILSAVALVFAALIPMTKEHNYFA